MVSCVNNLLNTRLKAEHKEFAHSADQDGDLGVANRQELRPESADRYAEQGSEGARDRRIRSAVLIDLAADEIPRLRVLADDNAKAASRRLGDWDPTCTDVAADSHKLYARTSYNREPFKRPGDRATPRGQSPQSSPNGSRQLGERSPPLEECGDGHKVAVAADVMTTWFGGRRGRRKAASCAT